MERRKGCKEWEEKNKRNVKGLYSNIGNSNSSFNSGIIE